MPAAARGCYTSGMSSALVRPACRDDLPAITRLYNHYVLHTPITFDLEATTPEARGPWFEAHTAGGRHRLFVAEEAGRVLGYAGTGPFRAKRAYDPTVETTIYLAPGATGRGLGSLLYTALFAALRGTDAHRAVAGITMPNAPSVALHRRFAFTEVGTFHENGRKLDRWWDVLWMEKILE